MEDRDTATDIEKREGSARAGWDGCTGRQPPPLSSVLYRIISGRRSVLAAQLLLREKSGA